MSSGSAHFSESWGFGADTVTITSHRQPQYRQPQYHQPQYHQPQYHQPQYHQPQCPKLLSGSREGLVLLLRGRCCRSQGVLRVIAPSH